MKFSVLLLYPDYLAETFGHDTYYAQVTGADVPAAIHAAQAQAVDGQQGECDPADFFPLLVVDGWHTDLAVQP